MASAEELAGFWRFTPDESDAGRGQSALGQQYPLENRGKKRRRDSDGGDEKYGKDYSGRPTADPKRFKRDPIVSATVGAGQLSSTEARIPWRHGRAVAAELSAIADGTEAGSSAAYTSLPTSCAMLRLHEEIMDFVAFISPTPSETRIAAASLAVVQAVILDVFKEARVEVFGSRANGLVLPTSDWDLVVFGASATSVSMRKLARELEAKGAARRTEVIDSARVPLVKAWEAKSGIQVDISFEVASGIATRNCISGLLSSHPPLRPLVVLLKYFLVQRGLNDTYTGGVGSFLLTLMAAHAVQATAKALALQSTPGSGKAGKGKACSTAPPPAHASGLNLGVLLLSFLELYGSTLNYTTTGITLRGGNAGEGSAGAGRGGAGDALLAGGYFSKSSRGWYDPARPQLLSLENPADPTADVGRNSWAVQRVRRACTYAHTALSRAIRAWESSASAAPGSKGSKGSSQSDFIVAPPPRSILSTLIRIDDTLLSREEEQAAVVGGAGGGGGSEPGKRQVQLKRGQRIPEGGGVEMRVASSSSAELKGLNLEDLEEGEADREEEEVLNGHGASAVAANVNAVDNRGDVIRAARARAMTALKASTAGTTIHLRRPGLLADVMSRKDRGVPAVTPAPPSWY